MGCPTEISRTTLAPTTTERSWSVTKGKSLGEPPVVVVMLKSPSCSGIPGRSRRLATKIRGVEGVSSFDFLNRSISPQKITPLTPTENKRITHERAVRGLNSHNRLRYRD